MKESRDRERYADSIMVVMRAMDSLKEKEKAFDMCTVGHYHIDMTIKEIRKLTGFRSPGQKRNNRRLLWNTFYLIQT